MQYFDTYVIYGTGGDGHNFIYGLTIHALLNYSQVFDFTAFNAHHYSESYIRSHLQSNNNKYFYKNYSFKKTCPFYITTAGYIDEPEVIKDFPHANTVQIDIDSDKQKYYLCLVNHYTKNFYYNNDEQFYNTHYVKWCEDNNYSIKYSTEKELPLEVIKKVLLYYRDITDVSRNLSIKNPTYNIPLYDVFYNQDSLISYVEKLTNKPVTNSVVQTIKNYQYRHKQCEEKFKILYEVVL